MNSRPIAQVAREIAVNEGTLGNWVAAYRRDHADEEPALDINERARLREAERLVRELKMENEFLKKAAAYFARESPVTEKYQFIESCKIDSVKYAYPVKKMCRWLTVSPSGFFDWKRREMSATARRRDASFSTS